MADRRIILVDMDGPLADMDAAFDQRYLNLFGPSEYLPIRDRNTFYIKDRFPDELQERAVEIIESPGFYRTFPPVEEGLRALRDMESSGLDVLICTSPHLTNPTGVQDKADWIAHYLGKEWLFKTVITKDKTAVYGDVLIDDKPNVQGRFTPHWQQLLYEMPWNKTHTQAHINWDNWREVLHVK